MPVLPCLVAMGDVRYDSGYSSDPFLIRPEPDRETETEPVCGWGAGGGGHKILVGLRIFGETHNRRKFVY